MSDHSDQPWDRRPVTARDAAFIGALAIAAIAVVGAALFIFLQGQPRAAVPATAAPASASGQTADLGQAIFQQSCGACHTIGGGTLVGPDLQGVTERRDRDWLRDWISKPDEMLAAGDPIAIRLLEEFNNVPMPNSQLSQAEVASVVAFLESGAGEGLEPAQAVEPSLPEGDPARGAALFIGATPLQNGGPACMSCHSIAGVGVLGGGTLGPDLTNVHDRYGEAGLAGALEGLPFPSMRGIFADRPLTDIEVGHLYAYFVQANRKPAEPDVDFNFALVGLGGFLLLILLSQLIWRKRLRAVRTPLVGRQP